jgi:DNA-binding NtrC family response regulator
LLVDDEEDIVTTLKRGLEKHGFEVDGFTSPLDALAAFNPAIHDILILDIRMPEMTGIQLFKEITSINQNVKVLFLTAFEILEKEWHIVLPSTEVHGFIKKPVEMEYLVGAISGAKSSRAN